MKLGQLRDPNEVTTISTSSSIIIAITRCEGSLRFDFMAETETGIEEWGMEGDGGWGD